MLFPWIVTSATWPRLTSFKKSEKARVACGPRLEEVWNRLKSATRSSPMTIQRARFLPKLFTMIALPYRTGHRAPATLPLSGGRPATFYARFTDKTRRQLNNCKARLRQRINRPKYEPRQDAGSFASVTQMRNGCDAIVVPHGRQNREEQPRQAASPSLRRRAVELGDSGQAQISESQANSAVQRQRNVKAAIPKNARSWRKPRRLPRAGHVAHHENALAPTDEATAAQRLSMTRSAAQHGAPSSDPLPPSRIEGAANRSGHGRQYPLRLIVRHRHPPTKVQNAQA